MGYTGTYITGKAEDYLRKELTHGNWTVLANSGAQYWVLHNSETGRNVACVANATNRKGYLTYKFVDETSGPGDIKFPMALLAKLSPEPENEWAAQWREKVRAYHAAKKAAPALKAGDTVRFAEPVEFRGGSSHTELVYAGGFRFYVERPWGRDNYRLDRYWRTRREWEVVTTACEVSR